MNRDPSVAGLASLVQSRGRRGDTMLVHMSPEEVQGLQRVALAAGGSLTINPDTGLVEANFLKKLLPTLLGFGLNFLFPGLGAIGSGLLVGGVEAARTGDLGKGLMAGLGAFGGAGFGSALSGVGAAATDASTKMLAQEAAQGLGKEAGAKAAQEAVSNQIRTMAANPTLSNFGAGAKELFTGGQNLGLGGFGAFKAAGSAMGMPAVAGLGTNVANAMSPDYQMPDMSGAIDDSYYEGNEYDPVTGTFRGGQWRKGYPGFPGYAMGGAVMPRANFNYPQAGISKSSYAPSIDYTQPREVLDGYEVKLDPFTGEEKFAEGGEVAVAAPSPVGPMIAEEYDMAPRMPDFFPDRMPPPMPTTPFQAQPQQSLEQYYQSLLTPPQQQRPADNSFMNYMQSLNNFVTSPVAPPPPPPQPPQGPPNKPPGDDRVTGTGGTGTGMRWDPTQGRFVPGTGSVGDTGIDFSELQNLVNSGMFSGFNFGDLGNFLQNGGYGDTTGLTYDPTTGSFRQPGSQTVDTAPTAATGTYSDTSSRSMELMRKSMMGEPLTDEDRAWMAQTDAENERNFKTQFQNMSPVTDIFAPGGPGSPVSPINYGDMSPYGTDFQGFQPLSTDFGSTYQAPAMNLPTFDASAYAPQQMDFGNMGFGLGSLPSIASTYQPQAVATPTFDMSSFQMPASQSPMMTGGDMGMSNMSTAPQFGFGNSDVLYGRTDFGMGGGNNIFGFAEGGAIQRAAAGKLITGDGDGMSDDIRANINGNQEARLADGEFVIPADVVSHLGNGSTDAGADQLHAMMDRIRKARTGRSRQAPEIDPDEYMPA